MAVAWLILCSVKIITNKGLRRGVLFHYAPFMLHVVFPEIVNEVYSYDRVYRPKTPDHSIGNFSSIYEELMSTKNIEVNPREFQALPSNIIFSEFKREYCNRQHFDKVRNYIFSKYGIDGSVYEEKYPEVLLVKRSTVNLIDDEEFKKQLNPHMLANGTMRREIQNIDTVEEMLRQQYGDKFGTVSLESIPHKEQVRYFNSAKYIICSHGGAVVNSLFCKEGTKIVEVHSLPNNPFKLFDWISETLDLQHIKCMNNFDEVCSTIR